MERGGLGLITRASRALALLAHTNRLQVLSLVGTKPACPLFFPAFPSRPPRLWRARRDQWRPSYGAPPTTRSGIAGRPWGIPTVSGFLMISIHYGYDMCRVAV